MKTLKSPRWMRAIFGVAPYLLCLLLGHKKAVPMLNETDLVINTKGCPRCKKPFVWPAVWKITPCPPWSSEDDWREFKEKLYTEVRAGVIDEIKKHKQKS